MPDFVEPQLATLSDNTPTGPQWVHEVKFDGYRAQVRVAKGKAIVSTRRGYDWSRKFPSIIRAAQKLPDCLIDGEAVVLDREGRTDFSALQSSLAAGGKNNIVYFAFDLLFLDGTDLRALQLVKRKEALQALLRGLATKDAEVLRYSEHFDVTGSDMHASACAMGLEGVVSKRIDAPYRSTRNETWIKSKCGERETFSIGGWRETLGGIQSLAMGEFRNGGFEYVGKARTGFQSTQHDLKPRLKAAEIDTIPFTKGRPERKAGQHWTRPELSAEVSFTTWTASKHVRHAKFLGLREDVAGARVGPTKVKAKPRSSSVQRLLPDAVVPTDEQLRRYWHKFGRKALKYLGDRPLTLVRHQRGQVFFHTGPLPEVSANVHQLKIKKREGGQGTRLWVDSVAGLLGLVEIGVIELHPWNSTVQDLEHPDEMVFDLDPGDGVQWLFVVQTALRLRDFLKSEYDLPSWPKATGGKGLHLVATLDGSRTHDGARTLSHEIASSFAGLDPRYTDQASLSVRPGRIFIDYLRNGRGQTAIGAYSPRARDGVPIARPLSWREASGLKGPDRFTPL